MNDTTGKYDGVGSNPKDPMTAITPDNERRLLLEFNKLAVQNAASLEIVIGASINMLCNSLRQGYPTYDKAVERLEERVGLIKNILRASYDQVTGNRKSIFPFEQVIRPGLLRMNDDKMFPPRG